MRILPFFLLIFSTIAQNVPDRPEEICPILVGEPLPEIQLRTTEKEHFNLNAAIVTKPAVLIFYRGGWCMYCSRQLSKLKSIESDLLDLGYQIIAISPDRPELLKQSIEKLQLKYQLMSDSTMTASKAVGLAFRLDDKTVAKYKKDYGIDIEADSGHSHHLLPVPAVLIVDAGGIVQFAYINPNYQTRVEPEVLLAAAKASLATTDNDR